MSTPTVFWAVIAVIAVIPWTPQAANALRSAWIPAPPPESEPAIDKARGIDVIGRGYSRNDHEPASRERPHVPGQLQRREPTQRELRRDAGAAQRSGAVT